MSIFKREKRTRLRFFRRKKRTKKKSRLLAHLVSIGFSNRLAVYILLFLAAGLAGGFYLARMCIGAEYTGPLLCWTVVFTPLGTAVSIALGKIVDKSKAENTEGGIKYAVAIQDQIVQEPDGSAMDGGVQIPGTIGETSWESPEI